MSYCMFTYRVLQRDAERVPLDSTIAVPELALLEARSGHHGRLAEMAQAKQDPKAQKVSSLQAACGRYRLSGRLFLLGLTGLRA